MSSSYLVTTKFSLGFCLSKTTIISFWLSKFLNMLLNKVFHHKKFNQYFFLDANRVIMSVIMTATVGNNYFYAFCGREKNNKLVLLLLDNNWITNLTVSELYMIYIYLIQLTKDYFFKSYIHISFTKSKHTSDTKQSFHLI